MATIDSDVDFVSAPKDYADLYKVYYPWLVRYLPSYGISPDNVEDVAMSILERFMLNGSLEKFDSSLTFFYRGQVKAARFATYFSRFVEMSVRGHRDRQMKLVHRELQISDVPHENARKPGYPDAGFGSTSNSAPWSERYGEQEQDHADRVLDMIESESEAEGVRLILARVPPRSSSDRCDLVAVFDAVRAQVIAYGEYDISVLRRKFNVSTTAMHTWMWLLKAELAAIYGVPVPSRRARRCK